MILIITRTDDFTCDYVVERLNQLSIDYLRINTDCIDQIIKLAFHIDNTDNYLLYNGNRLDVRSVWFRRFGFAKLSSAYSIFEEQYIYKEFRELIYSIQYYLPDIVWMSNPEKIRIAENKSLQLFTAKKLGFKIPKTIMTADIASAMNSLEKSNVSSIMKPIHIGRYYNGDEYIHIFTNRVTDTILDYASENSLPSIFQHEVSKSKELRVTVVGNDCFAASTESHKEKITSVDWRRGESKFEKYELPLKIREKCVEMTKLLGLRFGAIDLIKDVNDEYIFIENNPNGQWAWIEFETGLPIRDSIIRNLTNKDG